MADKAVEEARNDLVPSVAEVAHQNQELLILVVSFLKKMSIFAENKELMVNAILVDVLILRKKEGSKKREGRKCVRGVRKRAE